MWWFYIVGNVFASGGGGAGGGKGGGLLFYTTNFIDLEPSANSFTALNYTQLYTVSQSFWKWPPWECASGCS